MVVHTGAGISTACGIPDFRGPDGVWTCEELGRPPPRAVSFDAAVPSITHMAIALLVKEGLCKFVISQNVDGLHLRSGLPRKFLAELHGNIFAERCSVCARQYIRSTDVKGMGLKPTGRFCDKPCGGALLDCTVDWDSPLPEEAMASADIHHKKADLAIVMGTSLRIRPAGNMPMKTVRKNGKPEHGSLVIINLQKTHLDSKADLRIFARVDVVMSTVIGLLGLQLPPRAIAMHLQESNRVKGQAATESLPSAPALAISASSTLSSSTPHGRQGIPPTSAPSEAPASFPSQPLSSSTPHERQGIPPTSAPSEAPSSSPSHPPHVSPPTATIPPSKPPSSPPAPNSSNSSNSPKRRRRRF